MEFEDVSSGEMFPLYAHYNRGLRMTDILTEVAQWLGFTDGEGYLQALPKERERIFERSHD